MGTALCVLLPVAACTTADDLTGFTVEIENTSSSASTPDLLLLNWLDQDGFVFKGHRIPASGNLVAESKDVLVTVGLEVNPFDTIGRRIYVQAFKNEKLVASAVAGNLMPEVGLTKKITVRLKTEDLTDEENDKDQDGVPDEIDNCSYFPNADQKRCPPPEDAAPVDPRKKDAAKPVDMAPAVDMRPAPDLALPPKMDAAPLPTGNLVKNGDFNDGTNHWDKIDGKGGVMMPGRNGGFALYETGATGFWRQTISNFVDNAKYKLQVYGTSKNRKCTAGVWVWVAGTATKNETGGFLDTFTLVSIDVTVPKGATTLHVIVSNNGDAECVVDDFDLRVTR